ncbi:MAG TPA: AAA family ATPase, partial [Sphaerochaeta sp.]|nr:AAA family ATPase [Sphaerochaeta sp.]
SDFCYIVEGYATGATVYEATGKPVVVAYSAGNLLNMAEVLRSRSPSLSMTIVADNDESGVGQAKAEQAAAKYGATVIMPPILGDANDFVQGGEDLVSLLEGYKDRFTEALITPKSLHEEFLKTLSLSWVIKDVIPESSGLTMIYGSPGTYKSFVAVDLALSIANGIDWHGKRTKQRSVLYIAAEGQFGILKRFEVWRKYHQIEELQNIAILPMAAKLDNIGDLTDLMNLVRNIDPMPGFIFFDTLARSMDGEENAKVDMGLVINAIDSLRHEFGIQAVVIHHSGKDVTRGARGSNSLEGATDTQFKMEKGKENYTAIMTCERQKDDEATEPIGFTMVKVDTGFTNIDGDVVDSLVPTFDYDVLPKAK